VACFMAGECHAKSSIGTTTTSTSASKTMSELCVAAHLTLDGALLIGSLAMVYAMVIVRRDAAVLAAIIWRREIAVSPSSTQKRGSAAESDRKRRGSRRRRTSRQHSISMNGGNADNSNG